MFHSLSISLCSLNLNKINDLLDGVKVAIERSLTLKDQLKILLKDITHLSCISLISRVSCFLVCVWGKTKLSFW